VPQEYPDHHDAELVLRLYELRREAVMRESRAAINTGFWPRSAEELLDLIKPEQPLNAPYRQTSTYWELAFSMARYTVINPDFLLESSGEGISLFARVQPWLAELRAVRGPREFINAEWIVANSELGKEMFARTRERIARTLAARKS
jgi:hypothetical protein